MLKYGLFVPLFALTLILSSATIRKNNSLIAVAEQIPLNNIQVAVGETIEVPLKIVAVEIAPKVDKTDQETANTTKNSKQELSVADANYSSGTAFKLDQLTSEETSINEAPTGNNERSKLAIHESDINSKKEENTEDNTIYSHVTISNPPTYPGGIQNFYTWLMRTVKYPATAAENKVQGTVYVSFTVEKDGSITDIKVDGRKLGYGLEEEAIRVMKLSKRWNPGMYNNKPARVKYNIPIKFSMAPEALSSRKPVDQEDKSTANQIKIRGKFGAQEGDPLLIIDGKKADQLTFSAIKPEAIESLSVLKDATAMSLYGKEAKHGVILVTTKSKTN